MHRHFLPSLVLSILAPTISAQCISGNLGTSLGNQAFDFEYPMQSIGFAFPFGGTTYTDIHITTKGMCYLSNAGVPVSGGVDFTATTAELISGPPRLCPMWSDIGCEFGSSADVFLDSSATRCVVTWSNVSNYGNPLPAFTVQMQIYATGEVYYFYSASATNNSTWQGPPPGYPCIVGASPGGASTLPTPVDMSTTGTSSVDTIYEEWTTAQTFDLGGSAVHMIATIPGWVSIGGTPANCASASLYGTGCVNAPDSIYELMPSASFDLANRTITWLRSGGQYIVLDSIPGTFVTPSASAASVAFGDDVTQTVALSSAMPIAGGSTTNLTICSNGHIATGAVGNGNSWTPFVQDLLDWAEGAFCCWHDYNPSLTGSGLILFEEVGGIAYVTWNGVYSYGTSSPDTFQFQFDVASGTVTLVCGTFSNTGNDILVGYSAAGTSPNPGATDLSSGLAGTVVLSDVASVPLSLGATGLPQLGTTFGFDIANVPNLVPFAFLFFGDTALPGISLSFLGMQGCSAYTNANLGSATIPVTLPAGTASVGLPIPNSASLVGLSLTTQAVAFSLATSLNLISSNGLAFTVGN